LKDLSFKSNLQDMSSPWIRVNVLSIDPETIIVDERQNNLIKVLEKNKFTYFFISAWAAASLAIGTL